MAEDLVAHAEEELVGNLVAKVDACGEIEDGDGPGEIERFEGEVFEEAERDVDIGERLRPLKRRRSGGSFEGVLLCCE
jgi:hypothetical protein